ncbi:MAG: hypothetical protein J7L45_00475 [Candidatus Aenigmarchaeota archaeon]|nr:hypothetical protein [Candidatus Aenigmarchaeota archaeon]
MPSKKIKTLTGQEKAAYHSNLYNSWNGIRSLFEYVPQRWKIRNMLNKDVKHVLMYLYDDDRNNFRILDRIITYSDVFMKRYDSIDISKETGLPKYDVFRKMNLEKEKIDEKMKKIREEIIDYAESNFGSKFIENVFPVDFKTSYIDKDNFTHISSVAKDILVKISRNDMYSGKYPEFEVDAIKSIRYLDALHDYKPILKDYKSIKRAKAITSVDEDILMINMGGFDSLKEDSFITYSILMKNPTGLFSKKIVKCSKDGDCVPTPEFKRVLDESFSWPSSRVFEKLNSKYDDVFFVDYTRFGPFLYSGIDLPLSPKEVIEKGIYKSEEDFKNRNPVDYIGCSIGEKIRENPEMFAFISEGDVTVKINEKKSEDDGVKNLKKLYISAPKGLGVGNIVGSGNKGLIVSTDEFTGFEPFPEEVFK